MNKFLLASLLCLVACVPVVNPTISPVLITVHASAQTQPWLSEVYDCAQKLQFVLSNVNDPLQADIAIRMGEPAFLKLAAYQIGTDDLLVVTNRESPLQNMTLEQVKALFSDPGAQPLQVWVFAQGEDIEQVFSRDVLQGTALTSLANLALSPQQMSDTLNNDKNSVGILSRRWKVGTVREIFALTNIPILALTSSTPQGPIKELLGCLQK